MNTCENYGEYMWGGQIALYKAVIRYNPATTAAILELNSVETSRSSIPR